MRGCRGAHSTARLIWKTRLPLPTWPKMVRAYQHVIDEEFARIKEGTGVNRLVIDYLYYRKQEAGSVIYTTSTYGSIDLATNETITLSHSE